MRYKQLGKSDLKVSVMGLGTWAMGGCTWGDVDDAASVSTIRRAIDLGINLIDTAPVYGRGHSEEVVGKALQGRRQEVVLATKCGLVWPEDNVDNVDTTLKAESIIREVEMSLKRLGTDYIDLYQMHYQDPHTPIEESMAALESLVKSGKVRYVGASNFDLKTLQEAIKYDVLVSYQPQFSLLYRDDEAMLDFCEENQIGVLSYGSLSGGILSGKYKEKPTFAEQKNEQRAGFYRAFNEPMWSKSVQLLKVLQEIADGKGKPVGHVAINWVNQQSKVTTALVGARNIKQIEENAAAGNWELTAEEIKVINEAYAKYFG